MTHIRTNLIRPLAVSADSSTVCNCLHLSSNGRRTVAQAPAPGYPGSPAAGAGAGADTGHVDEMSTYAC